MADQKKDKKKETFWERLKWSYQIMVFRHHNYEEVWNKNFTKLHVFTYAMFFLIIYTLFVVALIVFTPLNQMLPAYHSSELQQKIIENAIKTDSLEYELHIRDQYLRNIKQILSGEVPENHQANLPDTSAYNPSEFSDKNTDSTLRNELKKDIGMKEGQFVQQTSASLSNLALYSPVNGVIVNRFNAGESHYGIDIVSNEGEPVLSVMAGTVISSDWTLETGYVIRVQHANDFISSYKHNAVLLKSNGDKVEAGEAIAIIGNTGEFTTGPHLHFELWYKGEAVNPEKYVTF